MNWSSVAVSQARCKFWCPGFSSTQDSISDRYNFPRLVSAHKLKHFYQRTIYCLFFCAILKVISFLPFKVSSRSRSHYCSMQSLIARNCTWVRRHTAYTQWHSRLLTPSAAMRSWTNMKKRCAIRHHSGALTERCDWLSNLHSTLWLVGLCVYRGYHKTGIIFTLICG